MIHDSTKKVKTLSIISFIVIGFIVSSVGCINSDEKVLEVSGKYLFGEMTIYNDGNFTWKNAEIEINNGYYYTIKELKADESIVIETFRFKTRDGDSFNFYTDTPTIITVRISGWDDLKFTLSSPMDAPPQTQTPLIYEGNIEDLLLSYYEIPLEFRANAERTSMPASEIFPDDEFADELGFREAHALTAMYFDENYNFGLLAQLVMRLDIEKMETAMSEYREAQEEDYEGNISSVNFGTIGDHTYGIKVSDPDLGDMYELVFIKDDIMVIFIVAGMDNEETFIKSLAQIVEGKI